MSSKQTKTTLHIYTRVSTVVQETDGTSLDTQQELGIKKAKELGFKPKVWNEGAKHLAKSAGTTPEERASFEEQLNAGYVDAFRALHPNAKGQYTYWSQRAGNRAPNKGLRLDYFICSESMMHDGDGSSVVVRDSYIVHDHVGSDHCPIVLELEIKK